MSAKETERMLNILTDLLSLTQKMSKSTNPDFLVEAIDRRSVLMEEYDSLKEACSKEERKSVKAQASKKISEMIELDKKISKTLSSLYHDTKLSLQSLNQNSKVLQYTNQAISSTGSYLDFKK